MRNRKVVLQARPDAMPGPEHWAIVEEELAMPPEGSVLVDVTDISMNPAMRNRMNDTVKIGGTMWAETVGQVRHSHSSAFAPGDWVSGWFGVQEHAIVRDRHLTSIDVSVGPASLYLGVLGAQGLTAYFGLREIAAAKPGETVVISAAGGAVGNVAVQIGTAMGCRVIGTTRQAEKAEWVASTLGADIGLVVANTEGSQDQIRDDLATACPDGIDVCFDNVGGPFLEAALSSMARGGRIVLCGATSGYDQRSGPVGPRNYFELVHREARMEGFLIMSYADRYEEGRAWIRDQIDAGTISPHETVLGQGIEEFPAAFAGLFAGRNSGKGVLRV